MPRLDLPVDEIVRLYTTTDETTVSLAKRFGCSDDAIRNRLIERGVKINRHKKRRMNLPDQEIVNLYLNADETSYTLAKRFGCSQRVILNRLHENGVSMSSAEKHTLSLPDDDIISLYATDGETIHTIAKRFGCSSSTILNRLRLCGVDVDPAAKNRRPLPDEKIVSLYVNTDENTCTLAKRFGCGASTILKRLHENGVQVDSQKNRRVTLPEDEIVSKYVGEGCSIHDIAIEYGCGDTTIARVLQRNKVCRRPSIGEGHPNWQGGISFEPYCPKFNEGFKKRVRAFFDNRCVICGKPEDENGRALSVHHVNYNKDTCCDDTIPMFAPLCLVCHSKTNYERERWEYMLSYIIQEVYNGESFTPK